MKEHRRSIEFLFLVTKPAHYSLRPCVVISNGKIVSTNHFGDHVVNGGGSCFLPVIVTCSSPIASLSVSMETTRSGWLMVELGFIVFSPLSPSLFSSRWKETVIRIRPLPSQNKTQAFVWSCDDSFSKYTKSRKVPRKTVNSRKMSPPERIAVKAPPPYEKATSTSLASTSSPNPPRQMDVWWNFKRPKDWRTRDWEKSINIQFDFESSTKGRANSLRRLFGCKRAQPTWHARLEVSAGSIPQLMSQGFHMSSANILQGTQGIIFDRVTRPHLLLHSSSSWRHERYCWLRSPTSPPEWTALLLVNTEDMDALAKFKFDWLTPDTTMAVQAWSWDRARVYYYRRDRPSSQWFNTLFDDKPLDGWWPWPKNQETESKQATHAASEGTKEN